MPEPLPSIVAAVVDGHVYVERASNGAFVWIGREADIEQMDPIRLTRHVNFCLYIDGLHTTTVH